MPLRRVRPASMAGTTLKPMATPEPAVNRTPAVIVSRPPRRLVRRPEGTSPIIEPAPRAAKMRPLKRTLAPSSSANSGIVGMIIHWPMPKRRAGK